MWTLISSSGIISRSELNSFHTDSGAGEQDGIRYTSKCRDGNYITVCRMHVYFRDRGRQFVKHRARRDPSKMILENVYGFRIPADRKLHQKIRF